MDVPNEVVEAILVYSSTKDLLQVCLAGSRLSAVASRFLYRNIPQMSPKRTINFLTTVCLSERKLATEVRVLSISLQGLPISTPIFEMDYRLIIRSTAHLRTTGSTTGENTTATLLAIALEKLVRLTHLTMYLDEADGKVNVWRLLEKCNFQLKLLLTTLPFDTEMVRFLETQNGLAELQIDPGHFLWDIVLPEGFLPVLTTLGWSYKVPLEIVKQLIKGRPVQNIVVFLNLITKAVGEILDIGPGFERITSAWLAFERDPTSQLLQAIAQYFPNLRQLRMCESLKHEVVSDLRSSLKCFRCLERVTIEGLAPSMACLAWTLLPIIKEWFEECKTLVYVALPEYNIGIEKKKAVGSIK
ncbi:hypothetical protein B0H34DRAFT_809513 [Crassisporium funariophilum]|nr:hypothetical protein B0H34DRAFT_809513 [Crassisporium funariophilum]